MSTDLPVLPWDIFEHIVIPDILSEHIHSYLLNREATITWHPFYVLPLVSRSFNEACQELIPKIFGVDLNSNNSVIKDEDTDSDSDGFDSDVDHDPRSILIHKYEYASTVCQRACRPGSQVGQTYHAHSRATLMDQCDLIGVYTCFALGKIFLNVDVLQPLGLLNKKTAARTHTTLWDEDYEDYDEFAVEPTKFNEENIHRCFMPFECAQRICDTIVPKRLALTMAEYMASFLPMYHSIPVFAKYELDLQFTVARQYYFNITDYTKWTYDTIRGLENGETLLTTMVCRGDLVASYWTKRGIPAETIQGSKIINALDKVVGADWGNERDTLAIRMRAAALIRHWTKV
ncbi:hypothetical protein BU17DRAFT_98495 [Hysterangium stoloniferum]|nr:hypothetical protein BU17DRAFT_98495 [Hysterangium stoloniferum]